MKFWWLLGQIGLPATPFYLPAILLTWSNRRALSDADPLRVLLVVLLGSPLALIGWAALNFGAERQPLPGSLGLASLVLTASSFAIVVAAIWATWHWRSVWRMVWPAALAAIWGTALAWGIGGMAIADDWI